MSGVQKSETILLNCMYIGYAWQALHCRVCQNLNSAMDTHLSTNNKVVAVSQIVAVEV